MRRNRATILDELIDTIGEDATMRLIEAHGGTVVYVADDPERGGDLARLLGPDAMRGLSRMFGRFRLPIPLAKHWRAQRYRDAEMSQADIARRLGMSRSGVSRLLQRPIAQERMRPAPPKGQSDLFE